MRIYKNLGGVYNIIRHLLSDAKRKTEVNGMNIFTEINGHAE